MSQLAALGDDVRVVVFDLSRVPVIDTSGLLALESALDKPKNRRLFAILAGPLPEPHGVFDRADIQGRFKLAMLAATVADGVKMARDLALLSPEWDARPS
jgi:anti-anti-sigma regulatory factor